MIKKQDDPRLKSQKQNVIRFEEYRQIIRTAINQALERLKKAQKSCLDEGSSQMDLFAAEKLQPEIDQLKKMLRDIDSLIPENMKRGS